MCWEHPFRCWYHPCFCRLLYQQQRSSKPYSHLHLTVERQKENPMVNTVINQPLTYDTCKRHGMVLLSEPVRGKLFIQRSSEVDKVIFLAASSSHSVLHQSCPDSNSQKKQTESHCSGWAAGPESTNLTYMPVPYMAWNGPKRSTGET